MKRLSFTMLIFIFSIHTHAQITLENHEFISAKTNQGLNTRVFGLNNQNWLYIGSVEHPISNIYFYNKTPGGIMSLRDNGNVGIGTTSPSRPLDIVSDQNWQLKLSNQDQSRRLYMGWYPSRNTMEISTWGDGIWENVPLTLRPKDVIFSGKISGGFGAHGTNGVLDWNDISNSRSGSGQTLLRGSDANNAPSTSSNYFHPFNFEYARKDGNGNITQLAIPYGAQGSISEGIYMRGRYGGNWTSWVKLISENLNGNVGIGTTSPDSKLTVAGKIHSQEVKVTVNAGADFVFEKDYKLPSLNEVQKYINENGHLPEIASAKDMEENGIHLSEMNIKLLQKIEELTLYTIEQEKKLKEQQEELDEIKTLLKAVLKNK